MNKVTKLRKGLNIKLIGKANNKIDATFQSRTFALKPTDFIGISPIPKLMVKEGAEVKAGDPVFFDKARPEVHYCSPVSGEVVEIRRGAKRKITEVVILADGSQQYREFPKEDIGSLTRQQVIDRMLESGSWPFLRQRPFNTVAEPTEEPKAIFISGFDTAPLAPDYNFTLHGRQSAFQNGIEVLRKLTSGKVHLNLDADHHAADTYNHASNVQINWFSGPHPAGNVGVQIHHIDPINKGDTVWFINPMDVINLGKVFTEGRFDPERIIAVTGAEVSKPRYIKTVLGASVESMVKNNLEKEHVRLISGNVLTGSQVAMNGHIGFFDHQLTVVEEGDQPELFGWLFPETPRPSLSRTFLPIANDIPDEGYRVNTSTHGEERAFVMSGQYERVLPMDIFPVHLLKAILARNFDEMEGLGIYEVEPEDMALCEFVCTSKIDVQDILREGLEFVRLQS